MYFQAVEDLHHILVSMLMLQVHTVPTAPRPGLRPTVIHTANTPPNHMLTVLSDTRLIHPGHKKTLASHTPRSCRDQNDPSRVRKFQFRLRSPTRGHRSICNLHPTRSQTQGRQLIFNRPTSQDRCPSSHIHQPHSSIRQIYPVCNSPRQGSHTQRPNSSIRQIYPVCNSTRPG